MTTSSATTQVSFIKTTPIKEYINDAQNMRSSDDAIHLLSDSLNSLILNLIEKAAQSAKADGRNTVMDGDITAALESTLKNTAPSWEDLVSYLLQENPTDLGKISKKINAFLAAQKEA